MSSGTVQDRFVSLEDDVRAVEGVVGVVVLTGEDGLPEELQVFVQRDRIRPDVREEVEAILADHGAAAGIPRVYIMHVGEDSPERTHVFEITRAAPHSRRETARDRERVALRNVHLDVASTTSDAHVSLGRDTTGGVGRSTGTPTEHNLRVSAAATVEALGHLLDSEGRFRVTGAALVEAIERRIVCVVLFDAERGGELVGSCPVRDRPVHEAAVRATLDAVNRQLDDA